LTDFESENKINVSLCEEGGLHRAFFMDNYD